MPAASGASHGLSAFVTLIIGALLSKYVWELVPPLGSLSLAAVHLIEATTGTQLPGEEQLAGTLVVMVSLSVLWGVGYHIGRHW